MPPPETTTRQATVHPTTTDRTLDLTAQARATSAVGLGDRPAKSLSPSRAGDFMTCPLLYRFRSVDRLPEPPGPEAARGTLVHAVLERLFDIAPGDRTPQVAHGLIPDSRTAMTAASPELPGLLFGGTTPGPAGSPTAIAAPDPQAVDRFLAAAAGFLDRYFALEDLNRLQPAERELSVSTELPSGLVLRGIIDRLDRAPSGAVRVVDYKTGRAPGPGWEAKALFQMRFYGLVLWRLHGQVPARLQLLYLGNTERLTVDPSEAELRATQAKVEALWDAIERATVSGDWQPRPSRLCGWCSFQALCPEFGGTHRPSRTRRTHRSWRASAPTSVG
ncbi:MAG: PD-(D/E)XK nuclease family protein [Candidatus Nanopelagicales bacterium]